MHAFLKRKLRSLLRDVAEKTDEASREKQAKEAARLETFLRAPMSPKKDLRLEQVPPKERKAQAKLLHKVDMAVIRQQVVERAGGMPGGFCEAGCGQRFWVLNEPKIDHWLGGSGRRRQRQSIKTCWALCRNCEKARTHNRPTAAYWNKRFEQHCGKYGYPFNAHVEHAPVARRVRC